MGETASLVFRPDGLCVGLYTEVIDLSKIGRLSVRRASRIDFDDERQVWRVRDRRGFPLFTSPCRQECLEWERLYFDRRIEREAS